MTMPRCRWTSVWVIRNPARTLLVDTGFSADMAVRRGRRYLASPVDLLKQIGIAAESVEDIVVTHMHYDHAGNIAAFPKARLHLQEKEMAYCTGRCMCHAAMRSPFEARDVAQAVERLHAGQLVFHDGDAEIAPGVSLHLIGGHTAGLQVVRVATERLAGAGQRCRALLGQPARPPAVSHRARRGPDAGRPSPHRGTGGRAGAHHSRA